jgi:hypothetical protein
MERGKIMEEPCKLKNSENAFQMYKLYINRHMKEGDWMWSRFKIYLSLNTGVVVLVGLLFKEYLDKLPFNAPIWLWVISFVLFIVGAYLANVWQRVCEDGCRWQRIIDEHIAALEPELFGKGGLYTTIVKKDEETKCQKKEQDVARVNIRLAQFFFWLWVISLVVSTLFIILTSVCSIFKWAMEFI